MTTYIMRQTIILHNFVIVTKVMTNAPQAILTVTHLCLKARTDAVTQINYLTSVA